MGTYTCLHKFFPGGEKSRPHGGESPSFKVFTSSWACARRVQGASHGHSRGATSRGTGRSHLLHVGCSRPTCSRRSSHRRLRGTRGRHIECLPAHRFTPTPSRPRAGSMRASSHAHSAFASPDASSRHPRTDTHPAFSNRSSPQISRTLAPAIFTTRGELAPLNMRAGHSVPRCPGAGHAGSMARA